MTAAAIVGVLTTGAVFLLLRRGRLPLVLGFVLLGHAGNVLLLSAGGLARRRPAFGDPGPDTSDPLPQAFALTAIVITFGITLLLLRLLRDDGPAAGAGSPPPDDGDVDDEPDGDRW